MNTTKPLKIRPYARLLTMLGEQLIKNERIALIELIKNSYDADASWVRVTFKGFGDNYEITDTSKIIIDDDGDGMNAETIEKHWLNPATPDKKIKKQIKATTLKGRVIQGEKGIGRFAVLKLGRNIKIISRAKGENVENIIHYDFSRYDDEFLHENGVEKELFLDNLDISLSSREPELIKEKEIILGVRKIIRAPHGTRIIISNLKGSWTETKVEEIYNDIIRLESFFSNLYVEADSNLQSEPDFSVYIYKDKTLHNHKVHYLEQLKLLLENQSVFRIENGIYNEEKLEFRYLINGKPQVLRLDDPAVKGLKVYRDHFNKALETRKTECGSFSFAFYIFDFDLNAPSKFLLDKEDKKVIRSHRIYLYRDGIRVYPYGEPDDDWLRIDMYRGTISAGHFLSNDQVVGCVNISQKENPNLKDKTNREGLIDEGNSTADFLALLRVFLMYIRHKPYAQYRSELEKRKIQDITRTEQIRLELDELKDSLKDDKLLYSRINNIEQKYQAERKYLIQRAETTEELAGVGLSVETASHDIMGIMVKALAKNDDLIKETMYNEVIDKEEFRNELQSLRGMLGFIEAQLKDIQLLFKSSKQRRKQIRIKEILEKVERIYKNSMKKSKINLTIQEFGPPLIAKTTDAVLLQLFLNLFDNSVYWLDQVFQQDKRILITLDGNKGKLIFSDNGPGIREEDIPYIFEPFYTGKGQEGRGLGLYIARQLLERNDYSIELAELTNEKILSGANFVVNFLEEGGE